MPLAIHAEAATLFDKNSLRADYFAGSAEAMATPEKIALGKALF
ncbi:hypothetical protein [Pontibacter rugosus]